MIQHLVFAGGAGNCIKALGVIQTLETSGYWSRENIKSIHGTSGGAILGALICMGFEWSVINDYMLLRPWHEAYQCNVNQLFDAFSKRGLFGRNVIEIFMNPFLKAKDISCDITLKEFYELTKIDFYMFTLEINEFEVVTLSYITHPDLPLLNALHMTSALPIIISPVCIEDKCYVDGGVTCNYPLNQCIKYLTEKEKEKETAIDLSSVLGIKNKRSYVGKNIVTGESSILEYMYGFINKLMRAMSTEDKQCSIPNQIEYDAELLGFNFLSSTMTSLEVRKELLEDGFKVANRFLQEKEKEGEKEGEKGVEVTRLEDSV